MKISVNIKVRNSAWYWTKEEINESKNGNSMSRAEWEMINESKIPKHAIFVDFEYTFEVKKYSDNRNGKFNLPIYTTDGKIIENLVLIENVTVIEFLGDSEKAYVVVSNDLIHQFIGAKKGNDGRFYWYFYLKENINCNMLTENIWLSDMQLEEIENQLKNLNQMDGFSIGNDKNIKLRSRGGILPISI